VARTIEIIRNELGVATAFTSRTRINDIDRRFLVHYRGAPAKGWAGLLTSAPGTSRRAPDTRYRITPTFARAWWRSA
jgi:hypothetical protein